MGITEDLAARREELAYRDKLQTLNRLISRFRGNQEETAIILEALLTLHDQMEADNG